MMAAKQHIDPKKGKKDHNESDDRHYCGMPAPPTRSLAAM